MTDGLKALDDNYLLSTLASPADGVHAAQDPPLNDRLDHDVVVDAKMKDLALNRRLLKSTKTGID